MTKLIDAKQFQKEFFQLETEFRPSQIEAVFDCVDKSGIVDAVPVIRCKDCKFVGTDATCCLVCNRDGMGLRPYHVHHDDYCSYAERKEE